MSRFSRMSALSVAGLLVLTLLAALTPARAAQLRLEDPARGVVLQLTGIAQPRYEYRTEPGTADRSSFLLRRLRVDLSGQIRTPGVRFRIMPELAGTASLRDGWIEFDVLAGAALRAGQFTLPFQWHRFVGADRQHLAERGIASETFGFPDGRDLGLMVHGAGASGNVAYAVGIFDGAGRNVARDARGGQVGSGRLTVALLGDVPAREGDPARSVRPQLALGIGTQIGRRNGIRDWEPQQPSDPRADWGTATADLRFAWRGASLVGEVYRRGVRPRRPGAERYSGSGFAFGAGIVALPNRLEAVARRGIVSDPEGPGGRVREWGAGVNLYQQGYDALLKLHYLSFTGDLARRDLILEYQIRF